MKLFQRLLVAPAALGLLAPISANATEINLNAVSDYSGNQSEVDSNTFKSSSNNKPTLISGGEGLVSSPDSDSFSETTTASFSADFAIGAVEGLAAEDAVQAVYGFQIDLNTSFTGSDSLDVSIDAGNGGNGLSEFALNEGTADDVLVVDGISYTFPVGEKLTFSVGNDSAGSALYSTACVYGTPSDTLDDCGNANSAMDSTGTATAFGASYDIGGGFTAAFGYEGDGDGTNGLVTKEGSDTYGGQLSYAADSYGASLTYANYNTSTTDTVYWGLNGYWTPAETGTIVPSVSVGVETGNPDNSAIDTRHYFVGLQWDEVGPGTFGAALGTQQHYASNVTEYYMYEAFYSYPVNDGMTITPLIYVKETAANTDDQTGIMVKTSFSF